MPSSPKFFYPRRSWFSYNRRASISICFLIIGIFGFTFGLISILRPSPGYKCRNSKPVSVSVVWEKGNSFGDSNRGVSINGDQKRHKVMGFVGSRRSLRKTWMPSNPLEIQRLEESTGLAFRFVIGRTSDESKMLELKKEVANMTTSCS